MKIFHTIFILIIAAELVGCSTFSGGMPPAIERSVPSETSSQNTNTKPASAKPSSQKGGGYYLDDGPGDNPPADIDAIPDAVPRQETIKASTSRPYSALGQSYTPMKEYQPYKAHGIASWYGRRYHGQKTASGEIYDMYGMTAAHTTLPIPSYVQVTNPENGKSVIVRVNDRGPFHSDRLIDLSYAAAYKLRITDKGSAPVDIEAINARDFVAPAAEQTPPTPGATADPDKAIVIALPAEKDVDVVVNSAPIIKGHYIQLGAFKLKDNADQLRNKLLQQNLVPNMNVENWYNNGIYRVQVGPYKSKEVAEEVASKIRQALGTSVLVLTQ